MAEKEKISELIIKFITILNKDFFKKLQECALHILAVDNGRIIENIKIKEERCSEAVVKLQRKYWKLIREIIKGEKNIKLAKKTFPMSKGALLAKMFFDCIGKDFSEVVSSEILEKKIEVTEEDYLLIANTPAFVFLCVLLTELWNENAEQENLKKIGFLVISNQDNEASLVTIFESLFGEI